ncbi:MAG: N-acetylmuramoyl-L-alanine amidase [Kiritimatiellales bacterium]
MIFRRAILISFICAGISISAGAAIRTIPFDGRNYVALNTIAAYYGMTVSAPAKDRMHLTNKWHTVEFETTGRRCWINGTLVWLSSPVKKIGWQFTIEELDFNQTVEPALRPYEHLGRAGNRTVVLDAGHGGKDNGAVSPRNVQEKRLTLDVTRRVRTILQSRGINVVLTRSEDKDLSLPARTKLASTLQGDLFVSIHANSAADRSANGIETFVLSLPGRYSHNSFGKGAASTAKNPGNHFDAANMALGFAIQKHLVRTTARTDRGVKRARFQVIKDAPCPAALVEIAFLSNAREEAVVIEAAGRDKIARGIADGISEYLNHVNRARTPKG